VFFLSQDSQTSIVKADLPFMFHLFVTLDLVASFSHTSASDSHAASHKKEIHCIVSHMPMLSCALIERVLPVEATDRVL
jgi:hypothetical protein